MAATYDRGTAGMVESPQFAQQLDLLAAGIDEYDPATQRAWSHHVTREPDGTSSWSSHPCRYVWPSELDLMAMLAGLELEDRWADWDRSPFTSDSESHVSVWRRPPEA